MEYRLVIDQNVIDDYALYYFGQHPKARKYPIERPIMPTLNQILILPRMQIAALKAKYKDFGIWLIKSKGYENLKLDKFEMHIHVCMPNNRTFDLDNVGGGSAKLLNDAFTESGFIIDDNYTHLMKLTITGEIDKEHPRTEIIIKIYEG